MRAMFRLSLVPTAGSWSIYAAGDAWFSAAAVGWIYLYISAAR